MALLCIACIFGGVAIMYKRQMMPRKFNVSLKFKNSSVNSGDGSKLKMSMPKPASVPKLNEIVLNSNDTSTEVNTIFNLALIYICQRFTKIEKIFIYSYLCQLRQALNMKVIRQVIVIT